MPSLSKGCWDAGAAMRVVLSQKENGNTDGHQDKRDVGESKPRHGEAQQMCTQCLTDTHQLLQPSQSLAVCQLSSKHLSFHAGPCFFSCEAVRLIARIDNQRG